MSAASLEVGWTEADGSVRRVGTITLLGSAQIQSFTYTPSWLSEGFEIGAGMPLQAGAQSPADGASTFGVMDDAGPDTWGKRVISRSHPASEVSTSLGMLAAVADDSRQGALRFTSDLETGWQAQGPVAQVEDLRILLADIESFTRGDADDAVVRRIYLGSSSQGGARPKSALRRADGSLVIAKFPAETDSYDVQCCEAVALQVARDAGLDVPASELVRLDSSRAILLVDRFERTRHGRLGYQSMQTAAMLGSFEPFTYKLAADTARYVSGSQAVRGVLGAAALAVCVHNIDDHARNLGLVRTSGQWHLAPLFDVVPFPAEQTGTPLDSTTTDRSLEQMLDIDWGLPRREVLDVVSRVAQVARGAWERAPKAFGLDPEVATVCENVIEASCDFSTVLDGHEPRFS